MRKFLLLLCISFIIGSCNSNKIQTFLVGTYTDSNEQGINVIRFDENTKDLSLVSVVKGIKNPSFVIANKAKTIVVAVEETASEKGGRVTSYSYDSKNKTFQKLTSVYTQGNHPCTLAFSPDEQFVLVGNYSGGSLAVFPIDKEGILSANAEFIEYLGGGINVERQEKPHIHCITVHPKEDKIFVNDLGSDFIRMIPFDDSSNSFLLKDKEIDFKINPGAGPRHMVWNKAGTKLYVTFELTNEVAIFNYKKNDLEFMETVALTAPTKNGSTAEIRLSTDERFVYASTRGTDNQICVIDVSMPKAKVIQTIKTAATPRNFILTKNQKTVLVAAQDANLVSVFDRDTETGLITATKKEISIHKPVYLFPF